ncbi:hypothetical protein KTD31_00915 [Burkholderia multivorans]|uniref:hypothetical protein n=1 Tax=Burkholderia multivorans TaxID=87883 RepID=UPI001C20F84C|nr:hypothetical protein [Burkholderia multivorans]MBU9199962.1 hypothetical protein [Burkholderia multivorans]MDN8078919.1 hypothetical protein [Burkholderia multivorans]
MSETESPIRAVLNDLEGPFRLLEPASMDEAIVGLAERAGMPPLVCYDRQKVIDLLRKNDGMAEDEAEEFFEFNIGGAYLGPESPMFITSAADLIARH